MKTPQSVVVRDPAAAGYAAVDALVAMLMISLTVVLSLRAVQQAESTAARAQELRRAGGLMSALMQDGPRTFETSSGQSQGFGWTLETQVTGAERPIALCRRVVKLESPAPVRRYWSSSIETCPPVDAS